jgi:glycosyltransferase involved in cell wall biosynthesis
MAATFAANKNHRCVVEAFDRAWADLPRPAVLQFAGNEEDGSIRRELERYLAGRPCAEAVRFFGRRDDIEQLFSSSHAVVLASFNEAFPNVLLEAMLCGRPVLASRVCEHPEIVGSAGERGWLFDPRRPEELAAAMVELGRMGEEDRMRMGARGRQWAQDNFSVARMVDETIAVYRRMLRIDDGPGPNDKRESA